MGDAGAAWLLAVESAADAAGAALLRGTELVGVRRAPAGPPASEALLPTLLELLAAHALEPSRIDAFAVSIGPGSFTGLRVGVATVKGLAFDGAARVAAVPTLAALAEEAAREEAADVVVALLDARRGEVYAAAHHAADPLAPPLFGPVVLDVDALADRLAGLAVPCVVAGEGVRVVAGALGPRLGPRVRWREPSRPGVDPAAVGRLGARLLAAGRGIGAAELAPLYVRRAEAEARRTGSAFEAGPAGPRPGRPEGGAAPRAGFDTPGKLP